MVEFGRFAGLRNNLLDLYQTAVSSCRSTAQNQKTTTGGQGQPTGRTADWGRHGHCTVQGGQGMGIGQRMEVARERGMDGQGGKESVGTEQGGLECLLQKVSKALTLINILLYY